MNLAEFQRLRSYAVAHRNAPRSNVQGKRHAKGKAKGVGSVYRSSRVVSQVGLDTQSFQRPRNGTRGY